MSLWLLLVSAWLLVIVPALAVLRRLDRRTWPAWTEVLSPEAGAHYGYLARTVERAVSGVEAAVSLAGAKRSRGELEEGLRILETALDTIAAFIPAALDRLDHWRAVSRAVLALYPLPPLRVTDFRLWRLSALAALHHALHLLFVNSHERFRLRLRILSGGFALLLGACRSTRRGLRRRPARGSAWRRAPRLAADFRSLSRASLATLRALLLSLPAAERPAA